MKQQYFVDKRVRPRVDIHLKANFEINEKTPPEIECCITNISVSGVGLIFTGLKADSPLKGQIITLEFFLPGTDRQTYVQGEIVWTKHFENKIEAGVNFFEPLSIESIIKCCSVNNQGLDHQIKP